MTRLDTTSEPSMEDILASIRKIIAEDPPGTRPIPPSSTPSFAAASQRPIAAAPVSEPFFASPAAFSNQSASAPDAASPTQSSEPYLRTMPDRTGNGAEPAAFGSEPYFAKSAEAIVPSNRIEPSFALMSRPVAPSAPAASMPAAAGPADMSVDAQLSDLLGEMLPSPQPAQGVADGFSARPQVDLSSASSDEPQSAAANGAFVEADSRPGFTVSRDGFVPAAPAPAPHVEHDPFDFDLGPSPFESKSSVAPVSAQSSGPFDLGGFVPSRSDDTATASSSITPSSSASVEPGPASPPSSLIIAAPSVAATIAPSQSPTVVEPVEEPISSAPVVAPAMTSMAPASQSEPDAPTAVERDVIEVLSERPVEAYSDDVGAMAQFSAPAISRSSSAIDAAQRTMEDTVADLLRPMLRTWLAENMPRIVERALRREITEQAQSETKTAAE